MDPEAWAASFESLAEMAPLRERSFPFPVRVLGGDRDQSVPVEILRTFAARIAGAAFDVVPEAPHQMALEAPGALLASLPFRN